MIRLNIIFVKLLLVCTVLWWTFPANADTVVTTPGATFDNVLKSGSHVRRLQKNYKADSDPSRMIRLGLIKNFYKRYPALPEQAYVDYAARLRTIQVATRDPRDFPAQYYRALKGLSSIPGLVPFVGPVFEKNYDAQLDADQQKIINRVSARFDTLSEKAKDDSLYLFGVAGRNPGIRRVLDAELSAEGVGFSANATSNTVINNDPAYRNDPLIVGLNAQRIQAGQIKTLLSTLTADIKEVKMAQASQQQQGCLLDLTGIQNDLQYQLTGEPSDAAREQAQQAIEKREITLEDIEQGGAVVSKLIGFANPKLGKQVGTVISSSIAIYKATTQMVSALSKGLSFATGIASAAATGNIIGAAMEIFSLFGSSGPSPDQLILDMIGEVKQQIETLRTEMHERFDRIDAKLNALEGILNQIMDEMTVRFDRIDFNLGVLNDNVTDIQIALVGLQSQLNRVEQNLFIYMSDVQLDRYRNAINGGLGFYDKFGVTMAYNPQYLFYENEFHFWATQVSKTALRSNPGASANFADDNILPQLSNHSLLSNINYLRQFPSAKFGLPALTGAPLANAEDWVTASEAYITLASENRNHAAQVNSSRLDQVVAVGTELQSAIRNITKQGSNANFALFEQLYQFYTNKIPAVKDQIAQAESTFYVSHPDINKLNIHGGSDQTINWQPPLTPANINFPGVGTLEANNSTLNRFRRPEPFVNAAYLNIAPAAFNLQVVRAEFVITRTNASTVWIDSLDSGLPDPLLGTGTGQYRYYRDATTYGNIFFEVALQWGERILSVQREVYGEYIAFVDRSYTNNNTNSAPQLTQRFFTNDAYSNTGTFIHNSWVSMRGTFEANSDEVSPTDFERSQRTTLQLHVAAQVQNALRALQIEFYEFILNTRLAGTNPLRLAVNLLSGAQLVWSSYITLGMASTIETSDGIYGILYGSQGTLNLERITEIYQQAISQLEQGINVPQVKIDEIAGERAIQLHGLLTSVLNEIQSGQRNESFSLVEDMLAQIDIYKNTRFVPTLRPATGVTAQVRSKRYDRATNSYVVQFFVRNNGAENLPGPLTLAFEKPSANGTVPEIEDAYGTALYTKAPYLILGIGADDVFSIGESVTVNVTFASGTVPRFSTRIMAGTGER